MSVTLNRLPGFGQTESTFYDTPIVKADSPTPQVITEMGALKSLAISVETAVGNTLSKVIELIKKIWNVLFPARYLLPPEVLAQIPETRLGKTSTANVRLAEDGVMAFEWKKKLCEAANESIEVTPNFGGGERFREFLEVIEKRMAKRPNLKVHMICSKELLEAEDIASLDVLKKNSNFNCLLTSPQITSKCQLATEENHVKLLVVDGKYFALGGNGINDPQTCEIPSPDYNPQNPANKYFFPKSFRDADVIGEGAIAADMRGEFYKLYSVWEQRTTGKTQSHFFPLKGKAKKHTEFRQEEGLVKNVKIKLFVCGPEHKNNAITQLYCAEIGSAKNNITIANSQFTQNDKINGALIEKKRKVKTTGIFNHNIEPCMIVLPTRSNYDPFHTVYEYDQGQRMYHKKMMVIDNKRVIIGSYNISKKSDRFDNEIAVLIDSADFAKKANDMLQDDIKKSYHYDKKKLGANLGTKIINCCLGRIFGNFT